MISQTATGVSFKIDFYDEATYAYCLLFRLVQLEFWQISQAPQRKSIHGSANPFSSMGLEIDPDEVGFLDLPGEL